MRKVPIWKRVLVEAIGIVCLALSAFIFVQVKQGFEPILLPIVLGSVAGVGAFWFIYVGAFGNSKQITKALAGIDRGISGGI